MVIAASLAATWVAESRAFEAQLVRCSEVTQPAVLVGCGADRLEEGTAEISDAGEVEITVRHAEPRTVYRAIYRSLRNREELVIGEIHTDSEGNGYVDVEHLFRVHSVGVGYVVLLRNGTDQFVSGFKVIK